MNSLEQFAADVKEKTTARKNRLAKFFGLMAKPKKKYHYQRNVQHY
jgi:hypothetical protein